MERKCSILFHNKGNWLMRKIAMVGTASSGGSAPYKDETWEIWGVSSRASYVTRANRWFELHRLDGEPRDWAREWRKALKGFLTEETELVMMYPEPDLAKMVSQYPYQKMIDRFGSYFMTSTFSWMMAIAIDELRPVGGEKLEGEIAIYGVDMEYGTEYRQQRVGFRHFMDVARVLGIPVTRLADSGLAYEPVPYPMWQDDPLLAKLALRNTEAKKKLKEFDATIRITQQMAAQCRSSIDLLEEMKLKEFFVDDRIKTLKKQLANLLDTSAKISRDIVNLEGADSEQQWLSDYLQP